MGQMRSSADGAADKAGAVFVLTSSASTRLVLSGEVDVTLSGELAEAAREAQQLGLPIEVDVRNVTFMDSSGMAALARMAHESTERLRFIQPPDVVRFLLDVTALDELVDVVDHDPGFAVDQPAMQRELEV